MVIDELSIIIFWKIFEMSQHQEIQIAPGVYITDFRPNATLKGIE